MQAGDVIYLPIDDDGNPVRSDEFTDEVYVFAASEEMGKEAIKGIEYLVAYEYWKAKLPVTLKPFRLAEVDAAGPTASTIAGPAELWMLWDPTAPTDSGMGDWLYNDCEYVRGKLCCLSEEQSQAVVDEFAKISPDTGLLIPVRVLPATVAPDPPFADQTAFIDAIRLVSDSLDEYRAFLDYRQRRAIDTVRHTIAGLAKP